MGGSGSPTACSACLPPFSIPQICARFVFRRQERPLLRYGGLPARTGSNERIAARKLLLLENSGRHAAPLPVRGRKREGRENGAKAEEIGGSGAKIRQKAQKALDAAGRAWYDRDTSLAGLFFCARFSAGRLPVFIRGRLLDGGAESMRVKIVLACTECKQRNYNQKKNKKNTPDRLEVKKYCRFCKKHTVHRETK